MNAKDAYAILMSKNKKMKPVKCYEYQMLFVFHMIPLDFDSSDDSNLLDNLYSVNKKTGKISIFKPFHISLEEYLNGKQIFDFK